MEAAASLSHEGGLQTSPESHNPVYLDSDGGKRELSDGLWEVLLLQNPSLNILLRVFTLEPDVVDQRLHQ